MRQYAIGAIIGAMLMALPAQAKNDVPSLLLQRILIKTSLLTLNDANTTGNYTVLHAKLAKPFREQFSPERLKQLFKNFADKHIDWGVIAAKPAIATEKSYIDKRGALILRGYFDTKPSHINYALDFVPSEGERKTIKLNVHIKPLDNP